MDSKEVTLLKKALERQKMARKQAERILEEKSNELYEVARHLRESNNKLENLLSEKTSELDGVFINIIDPYVVMDLSYNVVSMNQSAKDFLGYDHKEQDINLWKLVHKDFMEYTIESFSSLKEVGMLKNYRAKILVKDDVEKWVEINASLIFNKEKQPIAAQGIVRDITQEMEVTEILSEQKRQLDIIVNASPLGIVLANTDKILKVNHAMTNLLGYSSQEFQNMSIADITASDDEEKSKLLMQQMYDGEIDDFTISKKYIHKSGEILYLKISLNAVKNIRNETRFVLGMLEDITKQHEAETKLKAEREKYSNIIANMNLGLLELDEKDTILLANQSFCDMSGFSENELIGKNATDFFHVENKNVLTSKLKLESGGESNSFEVEILNKLGEKKHWLISGAPRYNEAGDVVGSVGVHLDVTKQKELELQKEQLVKDLENSNQGLQEYAHIVSHDLKSPLRSISALATWLSDDYKDVLDEGGKQNLALMQEKVASMDKLIHGILEYSTANSSALDDSKVDLNEVITDIGETIFIPEHVKLVIPKELPTIMADRIKVHQVFQNIIGNAVVHIEREVGLVEVLYKDDGDFWQFTISDNGVGIPEEYHKKIFDIFQSIGNNERSTGIGLSIVKKIIDRYQGRVWVDSIVGEGTQFHFTIKKDHN
ncbi:PAS domain S-box protein [Maribacter sp. M208]|uniref:PAS domain-containing sensor histidine kinase n=1 Tax=Maribacter huludaoensis TaxID=3030010 RepID=UPI0023EBC3AD|nr:PAS domain-containing sensor histidine kinase [Maribacter huludaoensis]MDF4221822.1 PAS domain S-box protein [Maribacter huludaoensis]